MEERHVFVKSKVHVQETPCVAAGINENDKEITHGKIGMSGALGE